MGECTFSPKFNDFGDRRFILDIGPPNVRLEEPGESDPGSIINGGSGCPVIRKEIKK
jgi:hypothetical protein